MLYEETQLIGFLAMISHPSPIIKELFLKE